MNDLQSLSLSFASVREAIVSGIQPIEIVAESFARANRVSSDGVFTAIAKESEVIRRAMDLQEMAERGANLPLLGLTFSVKDNIHVEGMVTTSNCPALSIMPDQSAPCVSQLESAGAILVGKNTMDQFATGLNGTRSPEPMCRNSIRPEYIPGGSSSGSAVAVARGIVSFSLGSDTGGSGRVPAACNGIIGLKPTLGLVSTRGLLYNSRYFDCVPVFALTCDEAYEILARIAGHDQLDPFSRSDADSICLTRRTPDARPIAVPRADQLNFFGDTEAERTFAVNLELVRSAGYQLSEIDFSVFAEAGRLVFNSAMVAERLCEYGEVISKFPDDIHPAVKASIEPGLAFTARDAFVALYQLQQLRREALRCLSEFSGLVVPTIPTIFTIAEMLAEPMARNSIMGTYTYFANPLDLCAISVPGRQRKDGLPSALCFLARAGEDGVARAFAEDFEQKVKADPGRI
jgi:allophanate hydrolase